MSRFSPEHGESRRQFEKVVLPAELAYVEDRRRAVGDDRGPLSETREISTGNDLMGLALSGGGIRSASFSLGFLQSLPQRLFRRIDYLSTVSGGGFIGSSVTALMANAFYRRQGSGGDGGGGGDGGDTGGGNGGGSGGGGAAEVARPVEFPFALTRSEQEPKALSHLRNNSNYMAPGGPGDVFRLLAVLLRGIILNSLALVPALLLVCLVVLLVYGQQLSDRSRFDNQVIRIDGLLGRYYGDRLDDPETKREIEPLLEVLEAEALLRAAEGKRRGDVIHQLRPALSFARGSEADLITGNGSDESPFRLTPGASRVDLARVLLEGDVLQRYEVIEEIDLLAREVEKTGYRHPDPDKLDEEPYVDKLVGAARRVAYGRGLIRPGTDDDHLVRFLQSHRKPRLKPVLQALYNGEYLNAEVVRDLVREERERQQRERRQGFFASSRQAREDRSWIGRLTPQWLQEILAPSPPDPSPAYYAYGWYQARVGQAFPGNWYVNHALRRQRVESEWRRLIGPFAEECTSYRSYYPPPVFRAGTTAEDVDRLLRFKELDTVPLEDPVDPAELAPVVEALYFGEYLDADWVRGILRETAAISESHRLAKQLVRDGFRRCPLPGLPRCCAEPTTLPSPECGIERKGNIKEWPSGSRELFGRLVLAEQTVAADLREVLEDREMWDTVEGWDAFAAPQVDELRDVLEALGPHLDDGWVRDRLYVYSYGWHRRLVGEAYRGTWCGSAEASHRGGSGCPEATDLQWREQSRARRDPSRWDPGRLTLPFTSVFLRLALGWVLLFPLLLIGARAIYRRRQRVIARESNPLRALLSSDQSINWRNLYEWTFAAPLMILVVVAVVELLPYAVHHFHYLSVRGESSRVLGVGLVSLLATALGGPALAVLQRYGRLIALAVLALAGPLLLLTVFVFTMEQAVYSELPRIDAVLGLFGDDLTLWEIEGGRRLLSSTAAWVLFAITTVLSIALALLIDINATSLHGLYRDRIAKAFMVGLDTEGDIEPEEDLALERICPNGSGAPYHLINVALNLQGSGDRSLRGRGADFLLFSRDHVGGPRTGFCRTGDLASLFPHAHLASAMAVSGAAVSPNMGRYKSGPLAILMSLLNTRLALWIPHPGAVRKWFAGRGQARRSRKHRLLDLWRRFRLRAPATLLLRELFGLTHDRGAVVNVSDGGHIENTGALELLRRRCRKIVLVDGEADPDMAFGGLALLQRIARIDMGIEIEIDLDGLRPGEDGLSARRSALGVIRYPERERRSGGQKLADETGELVYVKLAVTGAEDQTVAEYRARHEDFPHQSTGDQAFDEGQLEAYRELGYLAGREAFGTPGGDEAGPFPGELDPGRGQGPRGQR